MEKEVILSAFSEKRFEPYFNASQRNWTKALELYRLNIRLSSKIFSVIMVFEVVLRNAIDRHYQARFGEKWLKSQITPSGFLFKKGCEKTKKEILSVMLKKGGDCTQDQIVAALSFSTWRYMFGAKEYKAAGNTLIKIFPRKPFGSDYNHTYVFKALKIVNDARNRIAHHEPLCFLPKECAQRNTDKGCCDEIVPKNVPACRLNQHEHRLSCWPAIKVYIVIKELLGWLNIDSNVILSEVDFVMEELKFLNAYQRE